MRCPVCKADNVAGPLCRRCKADLFLLFELEARRDWELTAARYHLARGDGSAARAHAEKADELRSDDESRRLRALACLLERDFSQALACHLLARRASKGTASALAGASG